MHVSDPIWVAQPPGGAPVPVLAPASAQMNNLNIFISSSLASSPLHFTSAGSIAEGPLSSRRRPLLFLWAAAPEGDAETIPAHLDK